jgi:uroporphyrinogen decarboxylase
VDKIPKHAFWTPEIIQQVKEKTGCTDPDDYFGIEVKSVTDTCFDFNPDFSSYFQNLREENRTRKKNWDEWVEEVHGSKTIDEWGVYRDFGDFYHFNRMTHTMKELQTVAELEQWPWPVLSSDDYFDGVKRKNRELQEKQFATVGYYNCIFEQAWYLRGMDNLFMDFYSNESFAECLLDKITEIDTTAALKLTEVDVDIYYTGDDVATQLGMMMSPAMWRKWIKPRARSIITEIKKADPEALVWYHSDGNNYEILSDLVEIGCDVLHPIQPECMDPVKVHMELGDRVAFWGTIGTQSLMPFGAPGEVRREVRRIIDAFDASNGGLIIAPTHFIEPDVPWENIVAFFDAVDEAL